MNCIVRLNNKIVNKIVVVEKPLKQLQTSLDFKHSIVICALTRKGVISMNTSTTAGFAVGEPI